MSKKLIAGAGVVASLTVALAPLATFATDVTTQTDELEVTIEKSCSFGHEFTDSNIQDIAAPAHNSASGDAATWATNKASKTMENGTSEDTFGTTRLSVYCNATNGYTITMSSSTNFALDGTNTDESIPAGAYSATQSGWTLTAAMTTSGVSHTIANGYTTAKAAAATTLVEADSATDNIGDVIDITYGVGVSKTQAADVYDGFITYTLAAVAD